MLLSTRLLAILLTTSFLVGACGDDQTRTVRLRAEAVAGATSAQVTYDVNGEPTSVEVVDGTDLDVEIGVNGEIEIDLVITNADDAGGVRCRIEGLGAASGGASGTESATCAVVGTVTADVSAVSSDTESTNRDGDVLVDGKFTAAAPDGYSDVSFGGGRVTFEGSDGSVWIDDTADRAATPVEFANTFGGEDTVSATIGDVDGALTTFNSGEASFVAVIDDDYFVFTSDSRSDQVELITRLVETIEP